MSNFRRFTVITILGIFFRRHFSPVAVYLPTVHLGFLASTRSSALIAVFWLICLFFVLDVIYDVLWCMDKVANAIMSPFQSISRSINQSFFAH